MRVLPLLSAIMLGWIAVGPVAAQQSSVYSNAVAPSRESLDRLNMRNEWTAYLPLAGRQDAIGPVQWVDGGQVFVQTRSGLLIALDSATGAKQWTYRYAKANANLYPVGLTDRFVFAVNVTTLYCLHRYTGLVEFRFDLPGLQMPGAGTASAGPVADERNVYLVLGTTRVAAYSYPSGLTAAATNAAQLDADGRPLAPPDDKGPNLSDQAAARYGSATNLRIPVSDGFERTGAYRQTEMQSGSGLGPFQKTPSMSTLPKISPPYDLHREITTPSMAVLKNMRRPYDLYPPHHQYNQQTPSVSSMPPSVAAAQHLANLRPRPVEPTVLWTATTPGRVIGEPLMTVQEVMSGSQGAGNTQLWMTTDGPVAFAVSKSSGSRQALLTASSTILAPAAGPMAVGPELTLGFFSLSDGALVAVDLPGGTITNPKIEWRANVGGRLNHKPFPTTTGVYASGDHAGVAKADISTGEIVWRTESTADRILAVNDEHVYIMNRRGMMLIYPRHLPNDPANPLARHVAQLDVSGFNVPVTNDRSDRILLAADNGLLICLRDASAKYVRPARIAPPVRIAPPKKEEPKKEEEKKEPEKKEA